MLEVRGSTGEQVRGLRPAAVAGTWYPGTAPALAAAVDAHLAKRHARGGRRSGGARGAACRPDVFGSRGRACLPAARRADASTSRCSSVRRTLSASTASPCTPRGGFATPYGVAPIDADCAAALMRAAPAHPRAAGRPTRANTRSRCSCRFSSESRPGIRNRSAGDGTADRRHGPRLADASGGRASRTQRAARGEHRSVALSRRRHGGASRRRGHRSRFSIRRRRPSGGARRAVPNTRAAADRRSPSCARRGSLGHATP